MTSVLYLVKKTKASLKVLACLWLVAGLVACNGNVPANPDVKPIVSPSVKPIATSTVEMVSQQTPEQTDERTNDFTEIIQDILSNPAIHDGKEVVIVGYYRGWNLFAEASGQSPVTRSDWVIKDKSGAIYVQAGMTGDADLSPSAQEDTNKVLRVTGFVRLTSTGQPYIEPKSVELIP